MLSVALLIMSGVTVPCASGWIMAVFSFTCSFPFSPHLNSSIITNGASHIPPPSTFRFAWILHTFSYRHLLTPILHGWFLCNDVHCCVVVYVYVNWPLPFHAIVQQTDAVPPSTLIIPVIPISTVPAEPAVISPSTSQVFFFSFLYFPTPPSLLFFSLSSCWSFFLDPCHSTARWWGWRIIGPRVG